MSKFMMICGPAGCGKSTFAKTLDGEVFSSDAIREELYGDASVQDNPGLVFKKLYQRLFNCLREGGNAILDATNLYHKDRVGVLNSVHNIAPDAECVCFAFNTDYETCTARNQRRDRHVPDNVIARHLNRYEYPSMDEGWDKIVQLTALHDEETHAVDEEVVTLYSASGVAQKVMSYGSGAEYAKQVEEEQQAIFNDEEDDAAHPAPVEPVERASVEQKEPICTYTSTQECTHNVHNHAHKGRGKLWHILWHWVPHILIDILIHILIHLAFEGIFG